MPAKSDIVTSAIRIVTLTLMSGLEVSCYCRLGVRYFVFSREGQNVKTVCTYRKAKVFAEGVAIGWKLGTNHARIRP